VFASVLNNHNIQMLIVSNYVSKCIMGNQIFLCWMLFVILSRCREYGTSKHFIFLFLFSKVINENIHGPVTLPLFKKSALAMS